MSLRLFVTSKTQIELFISEWKIDNFEALSSWKEKLNENENGIIFFFKKKINVNHLKNSQDI